MPNFLMNKSMSSVVMETRQEFRCGVPHADLQSQLAGDISRDILVTH